MWMIPCCALVSLDPEGLWNKEIFTYVGLSFYYIGVLASLELNQESLSS